MNKISKLALAVSVLFLSTWLLIGCTDGAMNLGLKVDTPKDGATVNTPTVTVSGRVVGTEVAGAKVKINNTDTPVKDGKYSADITLAEGKNVIDIVATSGQAAPSAQITVTYQK